MFATTQNLQSLAQSESAKILVLSDSHGRSANFYNVLTEQKNKVDALFFLGDGADDLISLYEEDFNLPPDEKLFPLVTAFVRGNGDGASYSIYTDSNSTVEIPESQILTVCHKRIFLTHGHNFGVYYTTRELETYLSKNKFDAGLFGHTHVPFAENYKDILLLNPGSISLPRNFSSKSYAVLTVNRHEKTIKHQFFTIN